MVFKFERLFHLSSQSLGLDYFIRLEYLLLVLLLRVYAWREMITWKRANRCSKKGFRVRAILGRSAFLGVSNDIIPQRFYKKL